MKAKEIRSYHIPTDEPYVENLNLVTGDKFDYDRQLLSDRQIKQLCIDETIDLVDKFLIILADGQKIQKWSIFQNLSEYIKTQKQATKIFDQVSKNFSQLNEFLCILGEGIGNYLQTVPKYLNKQLVQMIFQLCFRTITQNPGQVQDWSRVLQKIAKYPNINYEKCMEYINGSFAMNSPPQKRRVAFCMIRHLMEYSKQIRKLSSIKALFFNKDQNAKTRCEVCYVLKKMLQQNPKDDQVWKAILEYFVDKDSSVRNIAIQIVSNSFYSPNFQYYIHALSDQNVQLQICKHLSSFIVTYRNVLFQQKRFKIQVLSFFNRIIKSKKIQCILILFNNLTQGTLQILGEGEIFQNINFRLLSFKNKQIFESFIKVYNMISCVDLKDSLHSLILKNLKQLQYQYYGNCSIVSTIFDLTQQQQITAYLNMCTKMLQMSKWHQLTQLIKVFKNISFCQSFYEKGCMFMLKLWMICPAFMVQIVIEKIVYLILANRRSFEFLITIRQKIMNAKFWGHRKNYIIFYSYLKKSASFQCHKFVPILLYKNIIADKSVGVRLTLLQQAVKIYKYTDPASTTQKALIKEAISKLEQDKEIIIRQKVQLVKEQLIKVDKNINWLSELYGRNRDLIQKQSRTPQVTLEPKKIIKTQNQISKSTAKSKRKLGNQQRKTINVGKVQMHKDMSIDSIALNMSSQNSQKVPTNIQQKKTNLFRCHSVKMKVPNKKI